jgi:RNA polymerase sigma-70 factor (ECF subfamily)
MEPLEEVGDSAVVTFEGNAADHAATGNDLDILSDAIAALPDRAREVIVLRKIKGLSLQEISAQLGISQKTCMCHITVALAKVRTFLAARGVTGKS